MVNLEIDGTKVAVPEDTVVLAAAAAAGVDIPHLCYCPGLESTGACRLCLVEIEGLSRPVVSCRYKVREGMRVRTQTEELRRMRRFVLELLLSRHPGDCLACEKSGECLLQRYAYELGARRDVFPQEHPGYAVENGNPFIFRDPNLCVLCGRCVRACQTRGTGVLDYVRRGLETKVDTPFGKSLAEVGCDFCGSCVEVCPTGALLEKTRRGQGRVWELEGKPAVCTHCGLGCAVRLDTRDGRVVRARAPSPGDYLCIRGRFGWPYLSSERRLTAPLVRKNGALVPAAWDEALDLAAAGLAGVSRRHGSGAVGGIIGAGVAAEEMSAFCRFIREQLQGTYVGSILSCIGPATLQELVRLFGNGGCAAPDDLARAGCLLVVGDVTDRVPGVWPRIREAVSRGATLIVVDFRESRAARAANLWLRCRTGMEAALLEQIAARVIRQRRYAGHQVPFSPGAGLEEALRGLEAERTDTGVGEDAVKEVAALLGDPAAGAVVVFAIDGLTPDAVRAALHLAGLVGRVPGGVFPGSGIPNLWGLFRAGAFTSGDGDLLYSDNGALRALYVLGEDPLTAFPGSDAVRARLAGLEFLVVQDLFLTPTAAMADVVLPSTAPPETGGTVVAYDGTVREFQAAVGAPVPPVTEVLSRLAEKIVAASRHGATAPPVGRGKGDRQPGSPVTAGKGGSGFLLAAYAAPYRAYRTSLSENAGLHAADPQADCLRLSPEDAALMGIGAAGNPVVVYSAAGTVRVRAVPDATLPAGVVTLPAFGSAFNKLAVPGQTTVPVTVAVAVEGEEDT
ncbi:MAG: molybdopterin-dependent oxidoreductase [Bacillota bacterium]